MESARTVLLEHARSRKNGILPVGATHSAKLTNPICGDHVHLQLCLDKTLIEEIGFEAKGCAICIASSSILSQQVRNRTVKEVIQLSYDFENAVVSDPAQPWPDRLEGLASFEHLKINPSRRACALLPWIALRSALT